MPSQILLSFGSPRSFSRQHFVVDDPECPNVTFEAVLIFIKSFRGHVDGTAHVVGRISSAVGLLHGKSKICNFDFPCSQEDVGRLEVSVYDSLVLNLVVPVDDLVHKRDGFSLRKGPPAADHFGKISSVA